MSPHPQTLPAFFWHFVKPYKWLLGALVATGLLWSIHFSLSPYLFKIIIDRMTVYTGNKADIFTVIQWPVYGYIVLWAMMAVNFRIVDWVKLRIFPNIRRDIINTMFTYLGRHSHNYLQNNFAGSLSNKIMDMAGSTASVFTRMDEAIANIFAFIIALGSMYFVNPVFSGILLVWAIVFIGTTLFFMRKTKALSHDFSESKSTLSGKIVDAVTNLTTMRLFARNIHENQLLDKAVLETVSKDRIVQWYILKMRIFWDISILTLIASLLGSLVYFYAHDQVTIGDFAFVMTVGINIFMHLWNLASQFVQFAEEIGKCSQALTIISAPYDVVDIIDAKPLNITRGQINFENVTFHYQRNNNLFENKHVEIAAGKKTGLVGFSGSGKTTFVNLILRFFNVESGRILIDSQDIAKVTQDSLHEHISMIPQDTSLFHRSLMENIRYGRLDASDEEVIEASKKRIAMSLSGNCRRAITH